jgi:hypothetical protein
MDFTERWPTRSPRLVGRSRTSRSDESKQIDFIDDPVASPQVESTRAGVSFMITQQQKETLRGLRYSEERIWKMKPEDAHTILKEGIKV